jgi:hypothetical protein
MLHKILFSLFRSLNHGTEFKEGKFATIHATADLSIYGGARAVQTDQNNDY